MPEVSKNSVTQSTIGVEEAGQRLDNFLLKICKGVPKSHIYRIVRQGEIRLNGKRADVSSRLAEGDVLRIPPIRVAERSLVDANVNMADASAKTRLDLPIVFEDDAFLVVDKPAGIAVHGGSGVSFGVIEALRFQRPTARFLELAHRLDRETSGLLLVAKKRSALVAFHAMFRAGVAQGGADRMADKRYFLLVQGRWMDPLRHAKFPLFKYLLDSGERRVRVIENCKDGKDCGNLEGKPSHTVFRLVARWQSFSLLEAELKTGRTHQIRVHSTHMGFPIAGDEKYGDFPENKFWAKNGLKRMFLHAAKISLPHPLSGEFLSLEAALPNELDQFLRQLSLKETQDYGQKI